MKKVTDNHRFYVVMPTLLSVQGSDKKVPLPCGMAAAQTAHSVSQLRIRHIKAYKNGLDEMAKPITTIVKRCRDIAELKHVCKLAQKAKIPFELFTDTNDFLYGKGGSAITAGAFGPITKDEADGILDYLPLWDCED